MKQLSAVLISYNEEEKIGRALASLKPVADEIVVVDAHSRDRTVDICRQWGARVIQRPWEGYRQQKQFATDQGRFPWFISLDADERLSSELQKEILEWKKHRESHVQGYWIPRLTWFMGRWIRHTIWYPDWQLRLFRRDAGRWTGGRLHEAFQVDGPTARLSGHIEHYTYQDISEYLHQLSRFSPLAAADLEERGATAHWYHLVFFPAASFVKSFLLRRGFLDGTPGFVVSCLASVSTFFKYLTLWERQHRAPETVIPGSPDLAGSDSAPPEPENNPQGVAR